MKSILSILMLIAVFTQLLWGSRYLVDYYVNSDYYKARCINKDLPQLNCDGKCILALKIKAQSKADTENTEVILPISSEYTWVSYLIKFSIQVTPETQKSSLYLNRYSRLFEWNIFKPPV
ncbi:MAG: hypothetical protein ACFHWX_13690 [Bacteroidota bacterium]